MGHVTEALRSLVRHVGRMLLLSALVTAVVAVFVVVAGRSEVGDNRYVDAAIVVGVLAALQAFFWFVLIYWADTYESPGPGRGE
jgi:hypothetical protein